MRKNEKREVIEFFVKLISKQIKIVTLISKDYLNLYFFSGKVDFANFTYIFIKGRGHSVEMGKF